MLKKGIILGLFLMATAGLIAQDYVDKTGSTAAGGNIWSDGINGNVGIGTASPLHKLDVVGTTRLVTDGSGAKLRLTSDEGVDYIRFNNSNSDATPTPQLWMKGGAATGTIQAGWSPGGTGMQINNLSSSSSGAILLRNNNYETIATFKNSLNVGIGVADPAEKLEVAGNIISDGLRINTTATSGGYIAIGTADGTGTTTPYDMVVNGHLGVHKLRVDINDVWGDFVFDEDYPLMSLSELEAFVAENKHLPEIPSDKEIEANGVDMGEMVRQQMIKIEELTLHIIELNKKVEALQGQ